MGFADLLAKVHIGEIWYAPAVFSLTDIHQTGDEKAYAKEVRRRIDVTRRYKGQVRSGNRIRVIGDESVFSAEDFDDFPVELRCSPGMSVQSLDGVGLAGRLEIGILAFVREGNAGGCCDKSRLVMRLDYCASVRIGKDRDFTRMLKSEAVLAGKKPREKKSRHYLEWDY